MLLPHFINGGTEAEHLRMLSKAVLLVSGHLRIEPRQSDSRMNNLKECQKMIFTKFGWNQA